jgi:acetylglutamate kinase
MSESLILVVKIGGSTLGSHDTTLEDLVALQGQGWRPLVVHGGGAAISEWLKVHDTPTRGGRAIGLSGADGGLIRVGVLDPELGYVGQIERVDGDMLTGLLDSGYLPVVAPLGLLWQDECPRNQILNINADTVAGEIALALGARWLVFLTDVPGIAGGDGRPLARLSPEEAEALVEEGVVSGGMIPKVEACLRAATGGTRTAIIDGRQPHALLAALERDELAGTVIGSEEAQ